MNFSKDRQLTHEREYCSKACVGFNLANIKILMLYLHLLRIIISFVCYSDQPIEFYLLQFCIKFHNINSRRFTHNV